MIVLACEYSHFFSPKRSVCVVSATFLYCDVNFDPILVKEADWSACW